MDINDLTIGQAKELSNMFGAAGSECVNPFEVGKQYLIRTVTHIQTGACVKIQGAFVWLDNAAWIADTGRFNDCLKHGKFNEVEPYPNGVCVNTGSIIDFVLFEGDLPTEQK